MLTRVQNVVSSDSTFYRETITIYYYFFVGQRAAATPNIIDNSATILNRNNCPSHDCPCLYVIRVRGESRGMQTRPAKRIETLSCCGAREGKVKRKQSSRPKRFRVGEILPKSVPFALGVEKGFPQNDSYLTISLL